MCIAAYANFSGVKYCLIKQVAVDLKDHCVFTTAMLCFLNTVSSGQREFVYNEPEFSQFLASVVERLPSLFSATCNSPLRKL